MNKPDYEQAIAEWRRQMLAAGVKTPVPLEELESHLREEIEQQTKSGLGGTEAFRVAVQKIGLADKLHAEFQKQTLQSRRGGVYIRWAILSLCCNLILLVCSISLMHSREAFNQTCGRVVLIASLIGVAGICIQAAAVYYSMRKSRR